MSRVETAVPVLGFPQQELAGWPPDLRPQPSSPAEIAPGGLILVHSSAAADYGRHAATLTAERRPRALLYLGATPPPRDAWRTFSGAVRQGDWARLRAELACPLRSEIVPLAEELPVAALADAAALLESAPYAPGALAELVLPPDTSRELREHLAKHESCRHAFLDALRARQTWVYSALHPPLERRAAFAYGATADAWVTAHLPGCASCAAEVDVLRAIDAPAIKAPAAPGGSEPIDFSGPAAAPPATVAIPFFSLRDLLADAPREPLTAQSIGAALVADFARAQPGLEVLPDYAGFLGPTLNEQSGEYNLGEDKSGSATLVGLDRELSLSWSSAANCFIITDLRGPASVAIAAFTVEIQRDSSPVWRAASENGAVEVPLAVLAGAIAAGARTLLIVPG